METAKKGYVTLKVNEGTQNKIKLGIQVLVGKNNKLCLTRSLQVTYAYVS